MKKILWLLALITLGNLAIQAQSGIASNRVSSSGSFTEIASRLSVGGEIMSYGYFEGTLLSADSIYTVSNGKRDYYLIRFMPDGAVDWMGNFGSDQSDYISGGMTLDSSGNTYISGGFRGLIHFSETDSIQSLGTYDLFLIKIDASGEIVWARNAGMGENLQTATALEIDPFGDLILAGIFQDSIQIYDRDILYSENSVPDYFFGKFDSGTGDLKWVKQVRTLNKLGGSIEHIHTTSDSYLFTGNYNDSIVFGSDTINSYNSKTDIHLISTDHNGNISWINRIRGAGGEYSQSLVEEKDGSIFLSGCFESDTLIVDFADQDPIMIPGSDGSKDLFIAKYQASGALEWFRTAGGKGEEQSYDMQLVNGKLLVSGHFSDTLTWGTDLLVSGGPKDIDMFTGVVDRSGNFINATPYKGGGTSNDQSRGYHHFTDRSFTLMRTNSDIIIIGDSTYISEGASYSLILGITYCKSISIDNVNTQDVTSCFGDSTGSIHIYATGGFGAPYYYSIDSGLNYSDDALIEGLPAGEYPIVITDKENCAQAGIKETIDQPEPLKVELVSSSGTSTEADGEIVVAASGGSVPYTYILQPGGVDQPFGTYTFEPGEEGLYVVEVSDAQNCGPVSTDTIGIFVLSDGDGYSESGVKLYPNPSSGVITLEMPFEGGEATLEVLSITGKVMMSRQVHSNGGAISETFDVSDLARGMYMLRVDGQTLQSGIVVN